MFGLGLDGKVWRVLEWRSEKLLALSGKLAAEWVNLAGTGNTDVKPETLPWSQNRIKSQEKGPLSLEKATLNEKKSG